MEGGECGEGRMGSKVEERGGEGGKGEGGGEE